MRLHPAQNSATVDADRRHDAHTRHDDAVRYAGPLASGLSRLCSAPRAHGDFWEDARQALAAAAPEPAIRARTRSTTEPTVLKSDASSLAL